MKWCTESKVAQDSRDDDNGHSHGHSGLTGHHMTRHDVTVALPGPFLSETLLEARTVAQNATHLVTSVHLPWLRGRCRRQEEVSATVVFRGAQQRPWCGAGHLNAGHLVGAGRERPNRRPLRRLQRLW